MSLLPEIERELMRAARRMSAVDRAEAPASQARRRPARRVRELAFTASLVAAAAVIAVGLLVTLHHGGFAQGPAAPKSGALFPDAPHTQPGDWARQRGDVTCPLAPRNPYLPAGAGCVSVTRADIDGTGQADLVLLYAPLDPRPDGDRYRPVYFELSVRSAHQRGLEGTFIFPNRSLPRIVSVRNVDGRPGDEIFVQLRDGNVRVYTSDGRHVVRAGSTQLTFDAGAVYRDDYSCRVVPTPSITQHVFFRTEANARASWYRADTTFTWRGTRLVRTDERTVPVKRPPARLSRDGC